MNRHLQYCHLIKEPSHPDGDADGVPRSAEGVPLHRLDALELSAEIEAGRISAVQAMECALSRIDSINPRLNAVVSLRDEPELMDEARVADEELRAGKRRGWLHGVPMAIKDLSDVAGLRTVKGSRLLAESAAAPPAEDDPFVRRLRNAGALFLGKTNTPEFGLGSHTFNPVFGSTYNPFDVSKSAGGSSGGAAAAVASGMLWIADGSDMMGSLRNPAGWNGLYSMRPTAGLIEEADERDEASREGNQVPAMDDRGGEGNEDEELDLPYPISTAGPIGRTPKDCAVLLQTMVGEDNLDLFDSSHILSESSPPSLRGKRVGWLSTWDGAYPTESAVLQKCEGSLRVLDAAGAQVVRVEDPPFSAEKMWRSWTTVRSRVVADSIIDEFGEDFLQRYKDDEIKPELRWEVERGLALSRDELSDAVGVMEEWSARAAELFEMEYDLLALPSAQLLPFPIEWAWPHDVAGVEMDTYHRWMECMVPVSLGGLPCATIPAPLVGQDEAGTGSGGDGGDTDVGKGGGGSKRELPVGVQLLGPRGTDAAVLSAAVAYHDALIKE